MTEFLTENMRHTLSTWQCVKNEMLPSLLFKLLIVEVGLMPRKLNKFSQMWGRGQGEKEQYTKKVNSHRIINLKRFLPKSFK